MSDESRRYAVAGWVAAAAYLEASWYDAADAAKTPDELMAHLAGRHRELKDAPQWLTDGIREAAEAHPFLIEKE